MSTKYFCIAVSVSIILSYLLINEDSLYYKGDPSICYENNGYIYAINNGLKRKCDFYDGIYEHISSCSLYIKENYTYCQNIENIWFKHDMLISKYYIFTTFVIYVNLIQIVILFLYRNN